MAAVLRTHWAQVFSRKQVDTSLEREWMDDVFVRDEEGRHATGLLDKDSRRWEVKLSHVKKANRTSNNSIHGPDGIPYEAYRRLGDTGANILQAALEELMGSDAEAKIHKAFGYGGGYEHCFNQSILCCLPKKPAGVDEAAGAYYTPKDTRPF